MAHKYYARKEMTSRMAIHRVSSSLLPGAKFVYVGITSGGWRDLTVSYLSVNQVIPTKSLILGSIRKKKQKLCDLGFYIYIIKMETK